MGKMRTWLVMVLSALFLCCAAAFAVGCSRLPSVEGENPTYTAQPDSVGATREEGQLRVELNEELLAQQPLFTTSALDDLKDYLTVTINEDGGDRVLGAEEYSLSGSMATAGEQTFTVTGSLRTPTEAGLGGCTITDWTHGGGGSGSAT